MYSRLWSIRLLHSGILAIVTVVIFFTLRGEYPLPFVVFAAFAPSITWTLGRFHERATILEAELATEEEIRERATGVSVYSIFR